MAVLSSASLSLLGFVRKQTNSRNETKVVSGVGLLFVKLVKNMYIFILGPVEP